MPESCARNHTPKSLVQCSLEIGRVLADRGAVTYRAKGRCMYPIIREGDILRIRPCTAADILEGDIAVCLRPAYLFSHRVIGKGIQDGHAFIITGPDRSRGGNDGPTFDEDLLGVVAAVERKGKPVSTAPVAHCWPMRCYFGICVSLMDAVFRVHLKLAGVLGRVQERGLYRIIARGCLALRDPQISYTVRLPMPALGDAVYCELSPESLDGMHDWQGRQVRRWTLALHLNGVREPAAKAVFVNGPEGDWIVADSFVRMRYRGAGLDSILLRQADAILFSAFGVEGKNEQGCGTT